MVEKKWKSRLNTKNEIIIFMLHKIWHQKFATTIFGSKKLVAKKW